MQNDAALGAPKKRMTRMRYDSGPMAFLSDQIVKEMQRAGYPAREHTLFRPVGDQIALVRRGFSRAGAYASAHQFWCAADIIHEKWAWFGALDAPDDSRFWETLGDCVEVVQEKYDCELKWGGDWNRNGVSVKEDPKENFWDPAHVEMLHWRKFRERIGLREPSQLELAEWFEDQLPKVWKARLAYLKRQRENGAQSVPRF